MTNHAKARRRGRLYLAGLTLLGAAALLVVGACTQPIAGTKGNLAIWPGEAVIHAGGFTHPPIEVTNTHPTRSITISAVELLERAKGQGTDPFFISGGNCRAGLVLRPGGICNVLITFGSTATADKTVTLSVRENEQNLAQARIDGKVPVSAPPTTAPSPAVLSMMPTDATLDASQGAGGSDFETFTVANTGADPTGVLAAHIQNEAGAPDFSFGSDTCSGTTLNHGDTCDVQVFYTNNTGTGQGTAELVVEATPGGTVKAALTGNGIA